MELRRTLYIIMAACKSEPGGDIGETNIQTFKSVTELSEYSKRTGKVFRNSLASSDNGNVVLRHLLQCIFSGTLK